MIGTLTRKTEPNQKWPSRKPLATGPSAPAAPVTLAQIAIAFGRSCAGEDVDDDRQRRRHDQRAGDAHDRAARDELTHAGRLRRERRADEEQHEPELQRALAAEAVAERAGREQQPGEHERVDRDDPLQLRLGRVQLARERGDRDVEARVADEDDQQAQAEDRERPPAAVEREHRPGSGSAASMMLSGGTGGRGTGCGPGSGSGIPVPDPHYNRNHGSA